MPRFFHPWLRVRATMKPPSFDRKGRSPQVDRTSGAMFCRFPPYVLATILIVVIGQECLSFEDSSSKVLGEPKLDSKRAFSYLKKICDLGSRTTGTPGMQRQQEMLETHFTQLGGKILWQTNEVRHPQTGAKVEVKNLVVQWQPENAQRVLLCTHYDTRPFPVMDAVNPKGLFVGANDGGSGTALFMELGHALQNLPLAVGVDLIFFDAEELVYEEKRDPYFLGSTFFAEAYANEPTSPRYRNGILVDMIGDAELQIFYEENSFKFAKPLLEEVWGIAKELKLKEFKPKLMHAIRDDHLPLNMIARIPVIDIIDFDFTRGVPKSKNFWHTTSDTPDKCSGESLTKVGSVLVEWVKRQK